MKFWWPPCRLHVANRRAVAEIDDANFVGRPVGGNCSFNSWKNSFSQSRIGEQPVPPPTPVLPDVSMT